MNWFKKTFRLELSQETKVYFEKQKDNQNQEKEEEDNQPKIDELEIEDSQQSSQESWCSTWSGLSQTFNSPKGQKREFSSNDEEEDKWWKSFCSVNEFKKETNSSSSQQGSSSQLQHETTSKKNDDKRKNDDENNDKDDDANVSFYLKVGKHKKFKYFEISCLEKYKE